MALFAFLLCMGDFNLTLTPAKDTTSTRRDKIQVTRVVNDSLEMQGMVDVWRETHPLDIEFTHYSATHDTHSRIDYLFMNRWDIHRVRECGIGVADVSDHNQVYATIELNSKRKDTVWRLNVGILNDGSVLEQIRKDIKTYMEENDTGESNPVILWDALKAVMRGKVIAITSERKKKKQKEYDSLIDKLKELERKQQLDKSPNMKKR